MTSHAADEARQSLAPLEVRSQERRFFADAHAGEASSSTAHTVKDALPDRISGSNWCVCYTTLPYWISGNASLICDSMTERSQLHSFSAAPAAIRYASWCHSKCMLALISDSDAGALVPRANGASSRQ